MRKSEKISIKPDLYTIGIVTIFPKIKRGNNTNKKENNVNNNKNNIR